MQDDKLNLTITGDTVTILKGDAPVQYPEFAKALKYEGTLKMANEILSKSVNDSGRINAFSSLINQFMLIINKPKRQLDLILREEFPDSEHYSGQLRFSKIFEEFAINTGKSRTTHDLADFIKMNRSYFETKDKAMELVKVLKSFRATVNKEVESNDDNRGNKKILMDQAVDSNIPNAFRVNIPVFEYYGKELIEIEIYIDSTDLSCQLISPEARDYVNDVSDNLIDAEVAVIKESFPDLRVIEVY
jgi:hypothetical protein